MLNPTENNVRHLAGRYGISMKRVDAILRLKGLERQWIKVSLHDASTSLSLLEYDEIKSISLEDHPMVKKLYMHGFLNLSLSIFVQSAEHSSTLPQVLSLKIVLQTPLTNPKCRIISLGGELVILVILMIIS